MSKPNRRKKEASSDPFERAEADLNNPPPSAAADEFMLDEEDQRAVEAQLAARQSAGGNEAPVTMAEVTEQVAAAVSTEEDAAKDQLSEFDTTGERLPSSRRAQEKQPIGAPRVEGKYERIWKIATWVLLVVLFSAVFYTIFKRQPGGAVASLKQAPDVPLQGKLLEITEIQSGWRVRGEGDRVSSEQQLITKETVYPTQLPVVNLKLKPSSANAFLRILFISSDGKIAGDPRVVKVVNGKIQASGTGDTAVSELEASVVASTGLLTQRHLSDYFAGNQRRWSIEISESDNYQAKGDEWLLLETFAVADAVK
jgi:hypothetical protein